MFNMLRMDFYRMLRSKSLYVILGFGLIACFISHITLYSMTQPDVVAQLIKAGAVIDSGDIPSMSTLEFINITIFQGGAFSVMMTILATLFIGSDFSSGYIKNILAFQGQRWKYALSKFITLFVIDLIALLAYILFFQVLIAVLPAGYAPSPLSDYFWYFISFGALQAGFIAMMLPVLFWTRSEGMGIGFSILAAGGLITLLAEQAFLLFGRTLTPLSLILQQQLLPLTFNLPKNLNVWAVGIGWCIIYTAISILCLYKKDAA